MNKNSKTGKYNNTLLNLELTKMLINNRTYILRNEEDVYLNLQNCLKGAVFVFIVCGRKNKPSKPF